MQSHPLFRMHFSQYQVSWVMLGWLCHGDCYLRHRSHTLHNLLWSLFLTFSRVSKLSTHHSGISTVPGVITHSAPHIVHTDLHSALIGNVTSPQSQLTICARSCAVCKTNLTTYSTKLLLHYINTVSTYLHILHQHHQNADSCVLRLDYWNTLVID